MAPRRSGAPPRSVSFTAARGASGDASCVKRAELFLRSAAFELWRAGGKFKPLPRVAGGDSAAAERALKHPSALVEVDDGEKVDCACGRNRSRGLMMACEVCGAWEHAECQGFRTDEQIPADYVCSACKRVEREEVVVLKMLEQGADWVCAARPADLDGAAEGRGLLWPVPDEDKGRDVADGDLPGGCCLCGCEDSEDFEALVNPCTCNGGAAVAHPGCVASAVQTGIGNWSPKAGAPCPYCGGQGGPAAWAAGLAGPVPPPL
eukprot:SM003822S14679  [mRNA]  locus=s3822:2:1368:+ [translate_table: standard]